MRRAWVSLVAAAAVLAGDPVQEGADAVLSAGGAKLAELAARDDPDPWLVADELCARGEHDAADAFARAAPRVDVEKVPDYVASRRGKPANAAAREALAVAREALLAKDFARALAVLDGVPAPSCDPVAAFRVAFGRGIALQALSRFEESAEAFLDAAGRARELGWLAGAARALAQAGKSADLRSDARGALAACEERLAIEEARGNRLGVAASLGSIGNTHHDLGDYGRALEYLERALTLMEALGNRRGVAAALGNIGLVHDSMGAYSKALECHERSLKLDDELGDRAGVAAALGNIGNAHYGLGDYVKALEYQHRALELRESLGDLREVARALGNIGNIHRALGDYPKALMCQERALRLKEELGDRRGAARTLGNIGVVHQWLGDYPRALECQERALKLGEDLGDRALVASALGNIGLVHKSLGDYAKALAHYRQALGIMEGLGDRPGALTALGNIGNVCESLGDYPEALVYQERALKLMEELGDRAGVARTLGNIGNIHNSLGDYFKALEYQERSLKLSEELGDRAGVATILGNIGSIHDSRGNRSEALEHFERSLRLSRELGDRAGVAWSLGNIGVIRELLGDTPGALACQEEALKLKRELGDRAGVARTLGNIGNIHCSLGDYAKALEHQGRGLAEAEELGVRATTANALWGLSRTHLARGDAAGAVASCRRAVEILVQLATGLAEEEGARTREQFFGIFDIGTDAALSLGDARDVCFFLESGRAATLLEALGGRDALRAAAIPEALRVEEAEARAAESLAAARHTVAFDQGNRDGIRGAKRDLDAAQEKVADVIAKIQRSAKAGASVLYPTADSLDEIRGRVREGEVLVSYGLLSDEALALVVTSAAARIVRLGATKGIEDACGGDVFENAEALRKLVVDPLGLEEETRLVLVSPSGALSCVPFALLLGGREVVCVPSGTTYGVLLDEASERGEGVLALGDPDHGPRLPATREEAKAVGDVVLLGADATESKLLSAVAARPRWRAVHLACHGLVDAERPRLSSLALSGGDLTTIEVFRMKVPADLVVLSACETARGKVYRAEGVVGFVRAFMFAGAPRVIVSLWKVDDEATRALMVKFYELWKGGRPTAAALTEAQAFVRSQEKWKHPRYWAAWVLWGLPD